jgi:quercetin dioxygenase-like cupin family protein
MKTRVIRNTETEVVKKEWGSLQWLVGADSGSDTGMTFGRVTFKPGQGNPAHYHPECDELLYVVTGTIEHSLPDGGTVRLEPGDCILLPRGHAHSAVNIGSEEAVVIVAFNSSERTVVAV